jgi:hypothetical protein
MNTRLNKKQRKELVRPRARELADSGKFGSWWEIEVDLRESGFPEARFLLDDEDVREELDQRCKRARARA